MNDFPGGIWPVMLTPFTEEGTVDYEALDCLTEWYIGKKVNGLFSVCQSSEMFCLTLEERRRIAERVVKGREEGFQSSPLVIYRIPLMIRLRS